MGTIQHTTVQVSKQPQLSKAGEDKYDQLYKVWADGGTGRESCLRVNKTTAAPDACQVSGWKTRTLVLSWREVLVSKI